MWHSAAKTTDIADGAGKTVEVAGQKVALFHAGGKFYALQDTCPHRGGPLGEGFLDGTNVTCPWHAWEFDVTSGKCLTMEGAKQKCFAVKVENDEVFVDL